MTVKGAYYSKYARHIYQQRRSDYLEERHLKLYAYEIKYRKKKKVTAPKALLDAYPKAEFTVIRPDDYFEFVS